MLKTETVYYLPKASDREGMNFNAKITDNFGKPIPSFMKIKEPKKGEI